MINMNEIISILKKYFNNNDITKIKRTLEIKQRDTIMNNNFFAKVGKNSHNHFFNNLIKEISLYENNQKSIIMPKLVDSFVSADYCLIVLEKVNGKTITSQRNNYNTHLSHRKRIMVAEEVLKIKNIKINYKLEKTDSRKDKLDKYLERSKKYLSKNSYLNILSLYDLLSQETKKMVVSHGDLIPTNIIIDKDNVKFIDWEYIAYRPEFYDLAYFLMFSKKYHPLDILDDLNVDKKEIYIDAIIICLKEIQNWVKLYGEIDNSIIDKNIKRWKKELNYILKKL